MYVSTRWLSRHIDLSGITPEELANDLTLSTAEVEGLERFAPHLSDVVVGHVIERTQHPDADKLSLCSVDVGGDESRVVARGHPESDIVVQIASRNSSAASKNPNDSGVAKWSTFGSDTHRPSGNESASSSLG